MTPVALTIAGSDSGGGAGIQADLKTMSALGIYGASVLTAVTAQNTRGVSAFEAVSPALVGAQIDAVLSDLPVSAIKIGMVPDAAGIAAVADGLRRHPARLVVHDPVMVATSGDRLIAAEAVAVLVGSLFPLAALLTPNLAEAAALLGEPQASSEAEAVAQAERIRALGARAVLVKGGHGDGAASVDVLVDDEGSARFTAPRVATRNTHGTGCTLSAAIAARLAAGRALRDAIADAKAFLTAALRAADLLAVGAGAGPVHHFHAWWPPA